MKKIIITILLLLPTLAFAQVFRSNQILGNPVPFGVVMSTSTALGSYLTASSSPTLASLTATSTAATSTFAGGLTVNGNGTSTIITNNAQIGGSLSVGGNLYITATILTSLTKNSVPYIGTGGTLTEDNTNLTYNGSKFTATYASTTNISSSQGAWFATSGGNVGIGTTTPGSNLSVKSGMSVGADYGVLAPSNGAIIEGNVGIGTTSPTDLLHIYGAKFNTDTGFGSQLGIELQNSNSAIGNYTSVTNYNSANIVNSGIFFKNIDQAYAGQIDFSTRSTVGAYGVRMSIDKTGNVGIGTTSPSTLLSLYDSGGATQSAETLRIEHGDAGSTAVAPKLQLGNQFLNPGQTIGGIEFTNNAAANVYASINAISKSAYHFYTDADLTFNTLGSSSFGEKMRITSTGNVGIGTTTPSQALDVKGSINVEGATSGIIVHDTVTASCYIIQVVSGTITATAHTCQ